MKAILDAFRDWRRVVAAVPGSGLGQMQFAHALDKDLRAVSAPKSELTLKLAPSALPVSVPYRLTEVITVEGKTEARMGDTVTFVKALRTAVDDRRPAPTDAVRIHTHAYDSEAYTVGESLKVTIVWVGLVSYDGGAL